MLGVMKRSVSQHSVGVTSIMTNTEKLVADRNPMKIQKQRGGFLWEGRMKNVTTPIVMAPWNAWFRGLVLLTVTYKYLMHFLIAYYIDKTTFFLSASMIACETVFIADFLVNILHAFWPLVRQHVRVFRRHMFFLVFDVISLVPLVQIFQNRTGYDNWILLGRWIQICRVYRVFHFFQDINERMRQSRKLLLFVDQFMTSVLILHGTTCMWYHLNKAEKLPQPWYDIGYARQLNSRTLKFDCYRTSFYYSACRFFNVIFGDSFPLSDAQKWLTTALMFFGFIHFRFRFIGILAWELFIQHSRRWNYVETYHHMLSYLKISGAPRTLQQQCSNYKLKLWQMKDGILRSKQLYKLPLPLQMELIFDINVGNFHNSLLFRDTKESFMRQISLLMRNEMFLSGQCIWSQGVVKSGMIYIKRGVIEMLSDEDDESPVIAFKGGTVLGELSLFYSIPSKVTVKAATYVELQVLRRTDLMRVIAEHPDMLDLIRKKIQERLTHSRIKQEAIEQYDKGDSRLIRTRYRPMKVLKDNLSGVKEEDPTFEDDSHLYYRDADNIRQPKFTREYLSLYKLSNNVTTVEAPRICLRSNFPWILMPDTDLTRMFDIAHFVMVLYVCIMSPYTALQNQQDTVELEKVITTIVLAGLLFNIYIQLTTAIVEKNNRKETVKDIAEAKMSTIGFYLDIISIFPVYIFTDTLDPRGETVTSQIAKLFPSLQVWHIWDYMDKWAKNFHNPVKMIILLKYWLLFLIFCYWSGCFLYLFACPRKLCNKNSWMSQLIYWETKVYMTNDAKHESPIKTAFSFGTAVFTGSGTSDISPGCGDIIVICFLFVLGSYLSNFYTAKVCSNCLLSTQRRLKFMESMRELFYFLSVNHVSGKIKSRVRKFFCVQWYYNNAVSTEEMFSSMFTNLKQEVRCLEMVDTLLYCPLFQVDNRDFLQTVSSKARKIVLPDNEVVQHAADIGRDMYIVTAGHCNVLSSNGKRHSTIGPGSHFGVIEMLFCLPKVHTIVTSTNCILLHLEYSSLVQCWGTFPDISHPIIMVLKDSELRSLGATFEEARPLSGRLDVKTNKITVNSTDLINVTTFFVIKQEIKESFVQLATREHRTHYIKTFESLGVLRHFRYVFMPGCITPHGMFLKCWCGLRFLLAVFYIITVPYNIATKLHKFGGSYNWVDTFSLIDIIVMSYVAYYNEKRLLVTHPLLTARRYMKRAFLWDLISVFPFEQLIRFVNDKSDLDLYRINRILCVTRITGAFSFWEADIMQVNPFVVLMKYLPVAFTIVNLATAFIFATACEPYIVRGSLYTLANCSSVMMLNNKKNHIRYAYEVYTYTFFWVYEIFVGLGCSPVGMKYKVGTWVIMFLQITGFLYFAFMFGYVASMRSASSATLLEHNEKTRDLANFLYQQNVDPGLTAKTLKYFEYVWKRTNGSNPQKICRRLNSALMEDTLVFMYERALREVPLFGKVERSFIRVITQHLHEMYFLKGDTVIQCRDIQSYIFIIYRGKVDVLTSYNEMITCMGPGGMFGNFTGQPISCSEVTIYASRSLDVLVIPSVTFFNLVKYYPKIKEPLEKAFENSRDYILPITLDVDDDTSTDDGLSGELASMESGLTYKSSTSRADLSTYLSGDPSSSTLSRSKSSSSISTYHSYKDAASMLRPGTFMFQGFGYTTCIMVTVNYVLCLYDIVTLNNCFTLYWMHAIFDVYFYFKMYMTMHQGYYSKHGLLIIDEVKCRERYFKHRIWVWSDVLVNFPLEYAGFFIPNGTLFIHYLRANRLFRIKYLFEFYRSTSRELTNNLTSLQAVMTVIAVVIMIHTFSCLWLITMIGVFPVSYIRTLKMHLVDTTTPHRRWNYVTSLYVVVSQLTATGMDEFLVDEYLPMSILGISFLCGKVLAAIVVASSIQLAFATKYALTAYEKVSKELIDMLKNQGLSNYQLKKIWKYTQQLWVTERGRQLPELLSQTPYVRRCDLMSAMFGHHLRSCYIFADTGESFLRQLTVAMDYTIFFPGNYIVVAGDSEARMYWVECGTVSVVSVRADFTEITHETLGPGDMFGIMQGLHKGISHTFSYRAETKVSILALSLDSWINILPYFPEAKRIISERCEVIFTEL